MRPVNFKMVVFSSKKKKPNPRDTPNTQPIAPQLPRSSFNLGFYDYLDRPRAAAAGPPLGTARPRPAQPLSLHRTAGRAARPRPRRGVSPAADHHRRPGQGAGAGAVHAGRLHPGRRRLPRPPGRSPRRCCRSSTARCRRWCAEGVDVPPARRAELRLPPRPAGGVPRPDRPHRRGRRRRRSACTCASATTAAGRSASAAIGRCSRTWRGRRCSSSPWSSPAARWPRSSWPARSSRRWTWPSAWWT